MKFRFSLLTFGYLCCFVGAMVSDNNLYSSLKELQDDMSLKCFENEDVDQRICELNIPLTTKNVTFESRFGFQIFAPKPNPTLIQLIHDIEVVFIGDFRMLQYLFEEHVEMLRKTLPAVTNHQLLAKALKFPKFRIAIDYSGDLSHINVGAMVVPESTVVVISQHRFIDETLLLKSLRNEFATINVMIANDCRHGRYLANNLRFSPFALIDASSKRHLENGMFLDYEKIMSIENTFVDLSRNVTTPEKTLDYLATRKNYRQIIPLFRHFHVYFGAPNSVVNLSLC
jgi:hypothetical protein